MSNDDLRRMRIPVLKIEQPIGEFFIGVMDAKDLVEISYSDVRRLVTEPRDLERYLGIQRPLSPSRVKELKRYVGGLDATFPTAVILSITEQAVEFEDSGNGFGFLELSSFSDEDDSSWTPLKKIAKVIDGQHRIAAFLDENNNWSLELEDQKFQLNVAIFVGADVAEQANIFATVNLAQTKVNKSLVYDLTELAKTPSPYKTCHNVAVALDDAPESPLYERIKRLGVATPGRKKEPLTQAAFVESLVKFISSDPQEDRRILLSGRKLQRASGEELTRRPFRNLFIDGCEIDIAEIIFNYFSAIRDKWPNSWEAQEKVGNLLPRSNAFKAFMVFLRMDCYPRLVDGQYGRIPAKEEFGEVLSELSARDEDFTIRNFAPGSGGQAKFLKFLRGEISIEDMVGNS